MMSTIHSTLSWLGAYAKQVEVSASNVADVNIDEFKSSQKEFVSVETGGAPCRSKRQLRRPYNPAR